MKKDQAVGNIKLAIRIRQEAVDPVILDESSLQSEFRNLKSEIDIKQLANHKPTGTKKPAVKRA